MQTDWKLLDKYITERSEAAFAALLDRHRNLVYNVCVRDLGGDAALAEDAAQVVFLILAKKAKSLRREVMLTGWLFRTARFTASEMRRRKRRLESRSTPLSQAAGEAQVSHLDVAWSEIDAHLNDALARLAEKDRVAVLMRYFDQMSYAEIASVLGQNEDAARHRVNRALEKMRRILAVPGRAALPAAAFAALLSKIATKPAPVHANTFPVSSSASSLLSSSPVSIIQVTQGVLKAMLVKQIGFAAAAVILVSIPVGVGVGAVRAQERPEGQGGGPATQLVAQSNHAPSQASPALPRQMTITFQFLGTTSAERSQATKIAGAPGESAAYTTALLRAGAVTREAPVVTDTDGVSAVLNSSPSLLDISMSHPAMSQKITFKPTINSNGTVTLACSVALDASSVPGASKLGKTSSLENTSIIQDGTKRLIGLIASPTAKGEIWYVFATARILPS